MDSIAPYFQSIQFVDPVWAARRIILKPDKNKDITYTYIQKEENMWLREGQIREQFTFEEVMEELAQLRHLWARISCYINASEDGKATDGSNFSVGGDGCKGIDGTYEWYKEKYEKYKIRLEPEPIKVFSFMIGHAHYEKQTKEQVKEVLLNTIDSFVPGDGMRMELCRDK